MLNLITVTHSGEDVITQQLANSQHDAAIGIVTIMYTRGEINVR